MDAAVCSTHGDSPKEPPRSYLVWYLVAPITADHDHVIEFDVAVHDTDGAAGTVVHVAESELDQPLSLPACTCSVLLEPAARSPVVFDRLVCSVHVESSELVWYLAAPTGAFQVQVIDDAPAVHETDGAVGVVVHVAESEADQPPAFPACTYSVLAEPAASPLAVFERVVCWVHVESSGLVWYLVAPAGAGHDQVIDDALVVHDTDGTTGIVVQDSESDDDHVPET